MTTVTPVLAYSSDEHGISLTTFYGNTENYEQTILVVKTTKGEVSFFLKYFLKEIVYVTSNLWVET